LTELLKDKKVDRFFGTQCMSQHSIMIDACSVWWDSHWWLL